MASLSFPKVDALIAFIAGLIKELAPVIMTIGVAKAAAEVNAASLRLILKQCDKYSDWCIFVKSTYKFTGWGTGAYNNGYASYELDSVEYILQTGDN